MRVAAPLEAELRRFDAEVEALREAFAASAPDPASDAWVRAALAHMVEVDQHARAFARTPERRGEGPLGRLYFLARFHGRAVAIERRHVDALGRLLDRHGWIRRSRFGPDADRHAWLLAHHADVHPAFQERVLAVLEAQVAAGETAGEHYARLFDRIAVTRGRRQRFGTQGRCLPAEGRPGARWEPHAIADAASVDARRRVFGLDPLDAQRRRRTERCSGAGR